MLFIRHATTPGMRAARFPRAGAASFPCAGAACSTGGGASSSGGGEADPASLAKAASAAALLPLVAGRPAWVSPARAAWQTAHALGLEPHVCAALGEADCGRWGGLPYEQVAREEPEALARWLSDPHAAPHGGESLATLARRVATWLDTARAPARRTPSATPPPAADGIVVCDAGVIRAALAHALGLTPTATARFDLSPLSTTELLPTRDGWRVAHVNRKA
ncbi:histidine phosphatase family protein [Nonomuraea sp. PA05]|uniref:histidine phosphatase family protein n=1 Tax=Nonomuraea sp. PA05 TaxID=2604466 RepID=UPI0011DBC4C1|nr:histidine phosphatase family protein [Nonomuraea sp. PA05]TYB55969.1 histidine phosphatase family protein [Nonomuraea sp. PA05]